MYQFSPSHEALHLLTAPTQPRRRRARTSRRLWRTASTDAVLRLADDT